MPRMKFPLFQTHQVYFFENRPLDRKIQRKLIELFISTLFYMLFH